MMPGRPMSIAALIVLVAVIVVVAGYFGYRAGQRSVAYDPLSTSSLNARAWEASEHAGRTVRLLRLLRANEHAEALEELEAQLDNSLVSAVTLSDVSDDPLLLQRSGRLGIWTDVKLYREQYPPEADDWIHQRIDHFLRNFPSSARAP